MSTPVSTTTDTVKKYITPLRRYGLPRLIKKNQETNPSTPPQKEVSEHIHSLPITPKNTVSCITPVRRMGLSHPKKKTSENEVSGKKTQHPKVLENVMNNLSIGMVRNQRNEGADIESLTKTPIITPTEDGIDITAGSRNKENTNYNDTPKKSTTKTRQLEVQQIDCDPKTPIRSPRLTVVTADVHQADSDSDSDNEPLIIHNRKLNEAKSSIQNHPCKLSSKSTPKKLEVQLIGCDPKTPIKSADDNQADSDSDSDNEPLIIYNRKLIESQSKLSSHKSSYSSYQRASTGVLLDSDDEFVSDKKRKQTTKSNISLKKSKFDQQTESESASSHFSTEDFLTEFHKDPQSFKKTLGLDDNPGDDKTDIIKKIEKISHLKVDSHNYIAVLCDVSRSTTEEECSNSKSAYSRDKSTLKTSVEDSDDEFTSTPETEQKQRENMLKKIQLMEVEVKKKEAKLEALERAKIYKNVHSPEKVEKSMERWMEGCRTGLEDLLSKLKQQGCIDMDHLIKQLRIPEQVVKKLNF